MASWLGIKGLNSVHNWVGPAPERYALMIKWEDHKRKNLDLTGIENALNLLPDYDWIYISRCGHLSIEFIECFADKLNWKSLTSYQQFPFTFIEKHLDRDLDWISVSAMDGLPEEFIIKHIDELYMSGICRRQKLSEDFLEKYNYKFNECCWSEISKYQKLSEEFITKHFSDLHCGDIYSFQKLSESFLDERFKEPNVKHILDLIIKYQTLSEKFIRNHLDIIISTDYYTLASFQKLPQDLKDKINTINPHIFATIEPNSWLYASADRKLEKLKKLGMYQIVDDKYIIAYKSCRADSYSVFNFQFKYEVGNTYESHCDCRLDEENSFGLSAWTRERAIVFCNDKLFKVKIAIEDIGAIVHEGGKIRCFKLEVLEEVYINE